MKREKQKSHMPSLTIDGKRNIISMACEAVGEDALLQWLQQYNIPSIRYLNEHVRRYKAKFFRALFELT